MSSTQISFENATAFSITGGNFGKVGGNITTVDGAPPLRDRSQGHASSTRTTGASSRQTAPSPPSSRRHREAEPSSRTSSTSESGRDETGSDRSTAHPTDQSHQASLSSPLPHPSPFHAASTSDSRHSQRGSSSRRHRSHFPPSSSMTSFMIPTSATLSTREAGSLPRSPQIQATVAASEITAPTVGSRASSSLSHIDPSSIQRPRNPEPFQQPGVPPSSTYMTSSYFAPSTPRSDLTTPEYSLWSSGSSRAPYNHDARADSSSLNNLGTAAAREQTPRHTHTWIHSRPLPLPPISHLHTTPTSPHASPYGYQHATNPGRPDVAIPNSQAMPILASPPPTQPPNVIPPYAMSMPLADARHPSVSMDGLSRGIADRRSHSPLLPQTSTNLMYSPYAGATLNPWHHYYYQVNAGSPYSSAPYNACPFPSTLTQAAGSGGDALPPYWQRVPHHTSTSSRQTTPSRRRYH